VAVLICSFGGIYADNPQMRLVIITNPAVEAVARPTVTFPASERHRPLFCANLYSHGEQRHMCVNHMRILEGTRPEGKGGEEKDGR